MKRVVVLLAVVALMMVMNVAPAFAAWDAEGGRCRTGDTLFPAGAPDLQKIDRNDDGSVCLTHRGHNGVKLGFYDIRDVV